MLAALIFRQFLLEQVRQGILETILLEIRAGDSGRVILGSQIIDLLQFRSIIAANDGGGVADLGVGRGSLKVRRQGGGGQRHGQAQRRGAKGKHSFHFMFLLFSSS